ncbi:MAG TPA: serine/threonine-protein kinase [Myxococcaceae bacterium]|nr:serine/threonine-protein kinase [Myxococcaceae bacterium]
MSSNGNALEGWTAGRWQVERRLRRGRVADAFQVRGPEGEGRVLRLLHPVHVVDAQAIARCLDEAKALLHPPHPGIVPVEDAGQLPDGRVYLVGEDSELPLHLELRSGLRPDELVCIAEQLAPALDALHARGLLHGHLGVDSLVGEPPRLTGVGFGVFQGGATQEWTGGRDPGRRVDQGLLGRLLLALAGEGPAWASVRAILDRCTSVDDALPFPSVTVLARVLRGACESDPLAETRHVPGPPPSMAVRAGESAPATVGPYRVLGLLGEGAMGRVFRAERDGRPVALKVLRREHLRSRLLLDRFFREARAVSRIRHPHIVEVIEVGEERGAEGLERAYCAMELLEGKTLGALFRERALDVARTVELASQVCEALEAAHATGVVHRDVKPDNVFVVSRRGGDWVKLVDFGIAKLLRIGPEMSRTPATVIGTPHYMAPEQASGAPVDGRTDLYALGVVLYEMLAGRRPGRVRGAPEPLPLETPAGEPIPHGLVRPILDCLSADPAARPQSAAALRAVLRATMAAVTPGTSRPAPALRPGRKAS